MTTPLTPEQRAALAKVLKITPETHGHLVMSYDDPNFPEGGTVGEAMLLSCPLTDPRADDLWLGPLMQWLRTKCHVSCTATADGWKVLIAIQGKWTECEEPTATAALLRAAIAAGVPEIVKAMEVEG